LPTLHPGALPTLLTAQRALTDNYCTSTHTHTHTHTRTRAHTNKSVSDLSQCPIETTNTHTHTRTHKHTITPTHLTHTHIHAHLLNSTMNSIISIILSNIHTAITHRHVIHISLSRYSC